MVKHQLEFGRKLTVRLLQSRGKKGKIDRDGGAGSLALTYGMVVSSTISPLTPNETRFWNLAIKPSRSCHPSLSQNTDTIEANLPAFSCKDWTMPLATLKAPQTSATGASFVPD